MTNDIIGYSDEPAYSFEVNEYDEEIFGNETESYRIMNFGLMNGVYLLKICTENSDIGVELEYAWIGDHFPGYERIQQELNTISVNGNLFPCVQKEKMDLFSNPIGCRGLKSDTSLAKYCIFCQS